MSDDWRESVACSAEIWPSTPAEMALAPAASPSPKTPLSCTEPRSRSKVTLPFCRVGNVSISAAPKPSSRLPGPRPEHLAHRPLDLALEQVGGGRGRVLALPFS